MATLLTILTSRLLPYQKVRSARFRVYGILQKAAACLGPFSKGGIMKIGILGAGNVGGALGAGWGKRGHEIVFGVRDRDAPDMVELLRRCDGHAKAGSPSDAAAF